MLAVNARGVTVLVALALCLGLAAAPGAASAGSPWAAVDSAAVTPGVPAIIDGSAQCTTNFVFTAKGGERVFLGMSAHCASEDPATTIDGCQAASRPLGTPVEIEGAEHPGELAYSSWLTMQQRGETDEVACLFNDFALVELHPADHERVNPTVPFWGGPQGLSTAGTGPGADVVSYGNSSLRLGATALSPKRGVSLGSTPEGWSHPVYTVTPGVPGDSGSAFLDGDGTALGSLSTLALLPTPASNGVTDLNRALDYLRASEGLDVELVEGTESFRPRLVPLDTGPLLGISLLP